MEKFTISYEKDDRVLTLELAYHGLSLQFTPENYCFIKNMEAESGEYNTKPGNGVFCLTWSPTLIELSCAKYGDGEGGSSSISIPTPSKELSASLRDALRTWKKIVDEEIKENEMMIVV
jgi:hypothetical protein